MSGLVDGLIGLTSPWGYLLVGLLACLEAAAFVGLVIPGETAMLLGGVLAATGHAGLVPMMIVASVGAVAGDSIGYAIGRHFGGPMRRSRLGRRIGDRRWRRAEDYLRQRGGPAVFFGRFVGVLRAFVPAIAGASRMPYRTFLPYNVAGGVLWACGFVLIGYLAGHSYQRVEGIVGPAGLLLLAFVVVTGVVIIAARWISGHPQLIRGWVHRIARQPLVARIRQRYAAQLAFLADRLRPGQALGLALTVQLSVLAGLGWLFGSVLQDVVRNEKVVQIDAPLMRFFAGHREVWLTRVMEAVTWLGSVTVLGALVVGVGLVAHRRSRSWRPLRLLVVTLVGAVLLSDLVKVLVAKPRPPAADALVHASGYSFPSGHATQATATLLCAALVLAALTASWSRRVTLVTVAAGLAVLVGVTRVYLGVHAPSDVLGGWALGGLWLTVTLAAFRLLDRPNSHPDTPSNSPDIPKEPHVPALPSLQA